MNFDGIVQTKIKPAANIIDAARLRQNFKPASRISEKSQKVQISLFDEK